uniref:Secreted protein n=1 Tax=Periophthalmus magnuspinnatus TaxID=409849 RepID=A0A3B4A9C0_9GOBI
MFGYSNHLSLLVLGFFQRLSHLLLSENLATLLQPAGPDSTGEFDRRRSTNHSINSTLKHGTGNCREHWGRGSVFPKVTTTAFICGSWNRTANLWVSRSDRSTNDVYVKSRVPTSNL